MTRRLTTFAVLCTVLSSIHLGCSSAIPQGTGGAPADALAKAMIQSVKGDAWDATGAVAWTFAGKHQHLWDKKRHIAEVRWDDYRAQIDIDGRFGRAWEEGQALTGEDLKEALDGAHAKWTNDAFWLNPVVKAFDPGVDRKVISDAERGTGLLVSYTSGGRTPGDAYLWWLNAENRPVAWQMWTSNIPIGGVEASWDGWVALSTGAMVSTKHETKMFDLELTDVSGADTIETLKGEDPFAGLEACGKEGAAEVCGRF